MFPNKAALVDRKKVAEEANKAAKTKKADIPEQMEYVSETVESVKKELQVMKSDIAEIKAGDNSGPSLGYLTQKRI